MCFDFLYKFRLKYCSFAEEFSQAFSQMSTDHHVMCPLWLADFNPLTPELNPSAQLCLTRFFTGILIFKGFTARRLYKLSDVKRVMKLEFPRHILEKIFKYQI
jgi:hypothetical protein